MKKTLLLCLLMYAGMLHAQTLVDSALMFNMSSMSYQQAVLAKQGQIQTANPTDTTEGSVVNEFTRRAVMRAKLFCGNAPADSGAYIPAARAMLSFITQPDEYCIGSGGNWQCMGPFNNEYGQTENQGRANCMWVCPTDTNYILAATYGGLWKTRNGGLSWHNISDGISVGYTSNTQIPGTMGMISLAVDPLDSVNIYVYLADWSSVGIGAAYSNDSGNHWSYDTSFNRVAGFSYFTGTPNMKMMYMPGTEKLFAFMSDSSPGHKNIILMKPNPSAIWQNITPALGADTLITDMEFTMNSLGKVVFSTNAADDTAHLWTYDTAGIGSWTNLKVIMPSSGDTITNIDDISLSATDSVFMLVEVKNGSQHLVCTPLASLNISVLSVNTLNSFQYIVVSPDNTNVIYTTNHDGYVGHGVYQSTARGAYGTFTTIGSHGDGRYITLYQPALSGGGVHDDVLYGCTDGGVIKKRFGNTYFQSITGDSLCITQLFSISNMEGEDDLLIGGAQDNGRFSYNSNRSVPWEDDLIQGDNELCKFMRNGVRTAVTESDFPYLERVDFYSNYQTDNNISYPYDECNGKWWSLCNTQFRPWYVDQHNTIFVGYRTLWKSSDLGATWTDTFSNGHPLAVGDEPKILKIAIAEPHNDTMYVAYQDQAAGDPTDDIPNNPQGKLFRTFNVAASSISWTNITPGIVQYWPMEDIEIDPQQPGRIWMALGGEVWGSFTAPPDSTKYRIMYSPNYGQNWYDVSRGLPPIAANKIKYRHGSNDQLYCATGLGVYSCDFSTFDSTLPFNNITWQCFNNGMPACNVTDMEFNYCAGKLRVSTFGRGIWQSDLPEIAPNPTDTITTNTTWTTNQYITTGIEIKSGATLTISRDTIHMPKNGIISVEAGGHLICDSCTITNSCDQCFWQGIQLKGSNTLSQTAAHQGWVTLKNGVIRDAKVGVTNYGNSGGIVQATNSSLLMIQTQ